MNYTDEEMDLLNEAHAKRKRFHAAKESRESDPEEYAEAKTEMSEHRSLWRGIRDYEAKPLPQDEDADGTSATAPVGVGSGVQQGGGETKEEG